MRTRKMLCFFVLPFILFVQSSFATHQSVLTKSQNSPSLDQLNNQTVALEKQILTLKHEVNQLKASSKTRASRTTAVKTSTNTLAPQQTHKEAIRDGQPTISMRTLWPHYITLFTSPAIGLRSTFDPFDLIVNLPSMNEDLRFLKQRKIINERYPDSQLSSYRPVVELSGLVEGQALYQDPFKGPTKTDINLTGAQLDVLVYAGPWATGFASFAYDDSPPMTSGRRINNSNLFVGRAFITIGNLSRFPVYGTLGQQKIPFGRYRSVMVTSTLASELFSTTARALLIGFSKGGFYASTYGFKGDANVSDAGVNQWGANIGYRFENSTGNYEFGAGYILNIADTSGIQDNGNSVSSGKFAGFAATSGTEKIAHRVPAYNVHAEIYPGNFFINAEYVDALRSFATKNLSFNCHGANLSALTLETGYIIQLKRPVLVGIGFNKSWDALGLMLPEDSYFAVVSTSFWKDTLESIEYRHDEDYSRGDMANGNTASHVANMPISGTGGDGNSVTVQVGIYF